MPQDPAPMDQLRDEPLRFLETEQFQEMLSVYRKLKPLEQENPRKFRNQLNTYDFSDIYPIMDTYLQEHALSDPEAVSAVMCSGVELSAADICKLVDAGNFKFGKVCNFGQCAGAAIYGHDELIRRFILLHHCIEGVGIGCVSQVNNAVIHVVAADFCRAPR